MTLGSTLRSNYSDGRVLCPDDAIDVENINFGHNDVERLDYGEEDIFYMKSMLPEQVERASESYRILASLGVDVPEVYSDPENGLIAVGSVGEDYRNLQYLVFTEDEMCEDIRDEELIKAASYKFVVSDSDVYSENILVSPERDMKMMAVDYEFAGVSDFQCYENAFFTLERFLNRDDLLEEVYEYAREMVGGLEPEKITDMYVEEIGIEPERAEQYSKYFRQLPDCLRC